MIEGNFFDVGGFGVFGDDVVNFGSGIGVFVVFQVFFDVGLGGVGGSQYF